MSFIVLFEHPIGRTAFRGGLGQLMINFIFINYAEGNLQVARVNSESLFNLGYSRARICGRRILNQDF